MTHQNTPAQQLAALLEEHRQAIAADWAKTIKQNASFIPSELWAKGVVVSTTRALLGIVVLLKTNSYVEMENYLDDLCVVTMRSGFASGEVVEALQLCKGAIMPHLIPIASQESTDIWAMIDELDTVLRWITGHFSTLCAANTATRLHEQQERTMQMLKLGQTMPGTLNMDELLRYVAEGIIASVEVLHCDFYLVNENHRLIPRIGASIRSMPRMMIDAFLSQIPDIAKDAFLREVMETKEPVDSYNVQTDPRANHDLMQHMGIKSVLAVPLVAHGQVLAIAMTGSYLDYRAFTEEQIELARDVARVAALVIENAWLYEKWTTENQSIQRIITALLQELDLEEILKIVCTETQHLTGAQGSAVYFLEDGQWLDCIFNIGDSPTFYRIPMENSITGIALRTGKAFLSNDLVDDERLFCEDYVNRNVLVAPLISNDKSLGVLYAANKPVDFTENDMRIASIFANHAAIAIENARLQEQLQQIAALEERERLAREIHDNLAQALSVLKLQASNIDDLIQKERFEEARKYLIAMKQTATEAHADAREAIFSLRNSASSSSEFLPALQTHLERFQRSSGIAVQLHVQPDAIASLSATAVLQLTRIVQEALTNVRKHARANTAEVRLERQSNHLIVTIEDNGQGFEPAKITHDQCSGVGLQIMRERAESLAGTLIVDTQLQHGTRVTARLPIFNRRQTDK